MIEKLKRFPSYLTPREKVMKGYLTYTENRIIRCGKDRFYYYRVVGFVRWLLAKPLTFNDLQYKLKCSKDNVSQMDSDKWWNVNHPKNKTNKHEQKICNI